MKTNTLKRIGLCMISAVMILTSGCGAKMEFTVNKDLSVDETSQYYLTEQEISQLIDRFGPDVVEEPFRKVTINGKQYSRVIQNVEHYQPSEANQFFSEINKKFLLAGNNVIPDMDDRVAGNELYPEEDEAIIDFADVTLRCPFKVYYTNGTLHPDGKTVDFDLKKFKEGEAAYAIFDKKVYDIDTVEFSGIKNKGIYNKFKQVTIKTKGVLAYVNYTEVKADYKEDANGLISGGTTTDGYKNWYFGTDGVYRLHVKFANGKKKNVEFTIDTTKPKTNMKNKTYKKGVKITFSDKIAGIKSATLNGEKIKSGKKVNKAGSYKLVLTDKAGNTKKVNFKVK
ncbi:MAG: hypothetical protein NC307_12835 [Roseburia sp.]|nr:hypothetical protein [Roseburia sp.]